MGLTIKIDCPSCSATLNVPPSALGKRGRCPKCKTVMDLGSPLEPAEREQPRSPQARPAQARPSQARPARPRAPQPAEPQEDLSPLAALAAEQFEATPTATHPCPKCGARAEAHAVLCVHCGYNFQTRKSMPPALVARDDGPVGLAPPPLPRPSRRARAMAPAQNTYAPVRAPAARQTAWAGDYPGLARLPYIGAYFAQNFVLNILGAVLKSPEAFIALMLLSLVVGLFLMLARLKNIGDSGTMVLLLFVPFANVYLLWRLICCPPGYAHTRQLDLGGKIGTWLFLLPLLLIVAVFIAGFAMGLMES